MVRYEGYEEAGLVKVKLSQDFKKFLNKELSKLSSRATRLAARKKCFIFH